MGRGAVAQADGVARNIPVLADPPDTGDAFDDFAALLTRMVAATEAAGGLPLHAAVLAEQDSHPELVEQWRATVGTAFRSVVERIVDRGQRREQLKPDLSADLVADLVLGAHLARYTYRGRPARGWPRQVVNLLRPALEP